MFLHDNRNAIRYAEQKGRQEEKVGIVLNMLRRN
jgi:hypothetical protein